MKPASLSIVSEPNKEAPACKTVAVNISPPQNAIERKFAGRAAVVTLGCAKNQVDSEVMIGVLRNSGFEIVNSVDRADVAVINTCGFLESAVKESVDCVLDISNLKKSGSLRKLIVAGCMVERYKGDIRKALPEVDSFIALDQLMSVGQAALANDDQVTDLLQAAGRPYFLYDETMPRHLASLSHTAYVKVSEGCNRPCTFCIIPQIRGPMRSRSIDSVVKEVTALGAQGVREINLVAQDLTSYGSDTKSAGLSELLQRLDKSAAVDWIRLLYAYPVGTDDKLLRAIVELPRVCNYLDVPLQHSSEEVLKVMKRPTGRYGARRFVEYVKQIAPEIKIRTTFIVGFPGETEEDVADLESFVAEGHFSSVGVFAYSPEQGTPAFEMKGQIPENERKLRRDRIMQAQQGVVLANSRELLGKTIKVLIDGAHDDTDMLLVGRAEFQAPEVDGTVIINDIVPELRGKASSGYMGQVTVTEQMGYDVVGTLVG